MALRPAGYVVLAFGAGSALGWLWARRPEPSKRAAAAEAVDDRQRDEDGLVAANTNLAHELSVCNRRVLRLARAGGAEGDPEGAGLNAEAPVGPRTDGDAEAASASSVLDGSVDAGGADPDAGTAVRIDLPFAELSADEWAKNAEKGTVPYRIPCLRDNPWKPPARELDKLGLAPQDSDAIREAYGSSNQRVFADVRPLCAAVVGSAQIADRIGPSACLKAVFDATRRDDPKAMKQALTRAAEVNAGKRSPPPRAAATPLEALLYDLTNESKAFASDVTARLGPEDAQRVLSARWLCRDSATVNADTGGPKQLPAR
jgi:hypothetical protein